MKHLLFTVLVVASLLISALVRADSLEPQPDHWQLRPELTAHELLSNQGAQLISTDAVSWPDGRSALILYIQTGKELYRCVDFRDASFRANGFICFQLIDI